MSFKTTFQNNFRFQLIFGLLVTFLSGLGFSIVMPVTPFLVGTYTSNPNTQATIVTLLTATYAGCTFFAAPILGSLSDRFGRRPILLISLLGATIGFITFGIGGSLTILFLGRIIEGLTAGNIATLFAYFADITPEDSRTKYFGWISAAAGFGTIIGPTFGGVLTKFGYSTPLFFAALLSFANFLLGYFVMHESLPKEKRMTEINIRALNPIRQISILFKHSLIRSLLLLGMLLWIPNGAFQSILSQFSIDVFSLKPSAIGLIFSIIGMQDILAQIFIMPRLINKLTDRQIATWGIFFQFSSYLFITLAVLCGQIFLFIISLLLFGFGESIFSPSFNGMLSKSANAEMQGQIQGGSQAMQSLSRIIGPILGGQLYVQLGHAAPFTFATILVCIALFLSLRAGKPVKNKN